MNDSDTDDKGRKVKRTLPTPNVLSSGKNDSASPLESTPNEPVIKKKVKGKKRK